MLVVFGHSVIAQAQRHILRVRHRFDARGVDGLHLLDQPENSSHAAQDFAGLVGCDFDTGQMCDAIYIVQRESHGQRAFLLKNLLVIRYYTTRI